LAIKKIAPGTADISQGPAMSRVQAIAAIEAGIEAVEDEMATFESAAVAGAL
jgi:nicotinate-nucleotide--dimethylbenzimidazole phosphoribosyltransferase